MLTRLRTNLRPPDDDDTFEELVRDLLAYEWGNPTTERFGRSGQKQYGVDVYGKPVDAGGTYRGAQAKLRSKGEQLSETKIRAEVAEARAFPHKLDELILATTAPRDTATQILVDRISAEEEANGGFRVSLRSWDRLKEQLAAYPDLLIKYYRDHYAALITNAQFDQLIHVPITVDYRPFGASFGNDLGHFLRLRGVRPATSANRHLDGVVVHLAADAALLTAAATLVEKKTDQCPYFVVLPAGQRDAFLEACKALSVEGNKLELLDDGNANYLADRILERCFRYGYEQRGQLATLKLAARQRPSIPNSALLDLDWQALFAQGLPNQNQWLEQLAPALKAVTRQLTGVRDNGIIVLDSHLYMPLAVAVGFHLNIRVAKLGVWTRREKASRFSQQFWFANGTPAEVTFTPTWFSDPAGTTTTTVLELSTMGSIHHDVKPFVEKSFTPDAWLELQMADALEDTRNIDEAQAVAYAEQVGKLARELRTRGLQDLHLFLKMPSALAVLIGQRLHACGRVHLYWFDNPSYRYAFTLT